MTTLADSQMANASESSSSEAASQEQAAGVAATSNGHGLLQIPQLTAAYQNAIASVQGEGPGASQGDARGNGTTAAPAVRLHGGAQAAADQLVLMPASAGASPLPMQADSRAGQARHLRRHMVGPGTGTCIALNA
jgi:hypothetical protein